MTQVGRNGPDVTWRGPEGFGLTLGEAGLLRSTRGLGFDLMATDVRPTVAALRQHRAGPVDRLMVHVDGEGQELRVVHPLQPEPRRTGPGCHRRHRADADADDGNLPIRRRKLREHLLARRIGPGRAILYQWVSPRIGHMQITTLRN